MENILNRLVYKRLGGIFVGLYFIVEKRKLFVFM